MAIEVISLTAVVLLLNIGRILVAWFCLHPVNDRLCCIVHFHHVSILLSCISANDSKNAFTKYRLGHNAVTPQTHLLQPSATSPMVSHVALSQLGSKPIQSYGIQPGYIQVSESLGNALQQ